MSTTITATTGTGFAKKAGGLLLSAALAAGLILGAGNIPAAAASSRGIGEEKARQAALDYTETDASTARFEKTSHYTRQGRSIYDFEYWDGSVEFDCEIDAETGAVLACYADENLSSGGASVSAGGTGNALPGCISAQEARTAALDRAGLSTATLVKTSFYEKQGEKIYAFTFLSSNQSYRCEVDAVNGDILSYYAKSRGPSSSSGSGSEWSGGNSGNGGNSASGTAAQISAEQAKSTALSHAGVSASSARKLKAKLDWENGRLVYEVEFDSGRLEYDYDIDANTGEILRWEWDD